MSTPVLDLRTTPVGPAIPVVATIVGDQYLRTVYGSRIRYIGPSRAGWPGMIDVETDDGYRTDVALADVRRDDEWVAVFGAVEKSTPENCPQGNPSPGAAATKMESA